MKNAVSFAVHEAGGRRVLAVRRPPDDPELPDVWGLPAASLRPGEGWEDALRRAGRDKLGVTLEPRGVLAEGDQERPQGRLHMRVYEAAIVDGSPSVGAGVGAGRHPEPPARAAAGSGTQYVDWRWADRADLEPAANQGSLCTRLYLSAGGAPPDSP